MTTKPRHTTSKKRHGADVRFAMRNQQAAQVDRDLALAIAAHYGSPIDLDFSRPLPERLVVRWSVRRPDGGEPFLFEHVAKPGSWQSVAEHEAKLAIKHAGLIAWVWLETVVKEVHP